MELVQGEPITTYSRPPPCTLKERLILFLQCATPSNTPTQKGIIHRDLKPGNILVASQDGEPSAKVIDFGIAKATASPLTDRTLYTAQHVMIGTPEYMSPEQAEGSLDIDTRTDVYALGVILYELLTGTTPLNLRTAPAGRARSNCRNRFATSGRRSPAPESPRPASRASRSPGRAAATANISRIGFDAGSTASPSKPSRKSDRDVMTQWALWPPMSGATSAERRCWRFRPLRRIC